MLCIELQEDQEIIKKILEHVELWSAKRNPPSENYPETDRYSASYDNFLISKW
jgi:hypothetical protein